MSATRWNVSWGKSVNFIASYVRCRVGAPDFTDPPSRPTPDAGASRSLFFPDEAIFPGHPRFKTLTRNIRERRREKVAINIPSAWTKTVSVTQVTQNSHRPSSVLRFTSCNWISLQFTETKTCRCYSERTSWARETTDRPLKRPRIIIFTWTRWASGWDAVACSWPFRRVTYRKPERCTTNWRLCARSWLVSIARRSLSPIPSLLPPLLPSSYFPPKLMTTHRRNVPSYVRCRQKLRAHLSKPVISVAIFLTLAAIRRQRVAFPSQNLYLHSHVATGLLVRSHVTRSEMVFTCV